jgi:hypothetical protein
MSLPDEEFDVLGEDELVLLPRQFKRLHKNRMNTRRTTRMRFQCGKPGHFVADCPKKTENKDSYKDGYKHQLSKDDKYRSRCDHKHKDERRARKKDGRGRKARAMVGVSDVDSSSAYSSLSSSSSEGEGDRCKNKKASKNLSELSCFVGDGFYGMARSSDSKKSHQSDSDSESKDEVHDELPFLHEENEHLGKLLDNRDDMLREAKKMRKELRVSLEDARNRVTELETQNLDAKFEIDSLKASPVVSDEIDCCDCSMYLADLTALKDKHASTCDKLDVLRVEVVELKSRLASLGACTSCPVLHGKIAEMHAYTILLEAKLKEPLPTSCSTCEVHAVKNLKLTHYVDRLQDENDELRKMMGWLSMHVPQFRMMIEAYKRYDGKALGSEKVGECSGEGGEKIGDTQAPPKTFHKNTYAPKPNPLKNKLDTTPNPPIFPHSTNDFQKPIKFKSDLGNEFFGKEGVKPSEEKLIKKPSGEKPSKQPHPKPKPKPVHFHCDYYGRDGHKGEFCFKRKCEERMANEWANKDKYHPSNGTLDPRMQMPRTKAIVRMVPAWGDRKVAGGAARRATPVTPVRYTGQIGAGLDK